MGIIPGMTWVATKLMKKKIGEVGAPPVREYLQMLWSIPSSILTGLIYAFSAERFRSTWFSIILHSGQSVFLVVVILGLVLGLA